MSSDAHAGPSDPGIPGYLLIAVWESVGWSRGCSAVRMRSRRPLSACALGGRRCAGWMRLPGRARISR